MIENARAPQVFCGALVNSPDSASRGSLLFVDESGKDVFEIIRNILWIHLLDVHIGVHGNADVCVTQPSLNIFQIKPLFVQDTGCAMTQIVKPQDGSEVISLLKTH